MESISGMSGQRTILIRGVSNAGRNKKYMKIPQKIKIGGHIYGIIKRDREKEDGKSSCGTHDGKYNKIWINIAWSQSQQESTLIHEIIEAINWLQALGLEDRQVQGLEAGLYQVLKDNRLIK